MEEKIMKLEEQLEEKNSMLKTAASAGQQLVIENDNLHKNVKQLNKQLKDKQDEIDSLKNTNEMLKITATRSGIEADELHKKLIESQKLIEHLREDNALLKSMNQQPKITHNQSNGSHSFDQKTANDIIDKLKHDKNALEIAYHSEQEKCSKLLQNAETNARKVIHLEDEQQDLQKEIEKLKQTNFELSNNLQHEIEKYHGSIYQLQQENESLRHNLTESQLIVNEQYNHKSPLFRHQSNGSQSSHDDGFLGQELEELGYFENSDGRIVSTDKIIESDDVPFIQSPSKQFDQATIDAQEEFFRLTVIAAKIKFNDIPISTATLWDKVKQANLSFHELADWLNKYLSEERRRRKSLQDKADKRTRIQSITNQQNGVNSSGSNINSPSKQFFQKIKDLAESVTGFSSTLRLEVRFGRRVFEVKMKKLDKLETLLATLPRIIGEDADAMLIYKGKNKLDPSLTLEQLLLNNNDILRMIHHKKVASYLRRYSRKSNESKIEMESESVTSDTKDTNK